MRVLPLLLLALAPLARADRLINVPVATKLLAGSVRLEEAVGFSDSRVRRESLLYAVNATLELEARRFRGVGFDESTVDVYATLLSPFKGYSPGFALGVRDALDRTGDGFRPWVAVTFREAFQLGDIERGADITLGAFFGARGSALVGVSIPLGPDLRLLAESDGIRPSAGLQYAIRGLEFRLFTDDRAALGSLRYSLRF